MQRQHQTSSLTNLGTTLQTLCDDESDGEIAESILEELSHRVDGDLERTKILFEYHSRAFASIPSAKNFSDLFAMMSLLQWLRDR